jgi:hypothetical protein
MRISPQYGMASRGKTDLETPRFGRCWWYWRPRLRWNGGVPGKDRCCDINFFWLCFWCGFYVWSDVKSWREPK